MFEQSNNYIIHTIIEKMMSHDTLNVLAEKPTDPTPVTAEAPMETENAAAPAQVLLLTHFLLIITN